MTDVDTPLTPAELKANREHFGNLPFYFEAQFEGEAEASILNVDEVWQLQGQGRKAVHFKGLGVPSQQQQAFLTSLAELAQGVE